MRKAGLGTTFAALALTGGLMLAMTPKAHADDDARNRCQHRVERAQDRYRHEVREHGRHSRQAEDAKARMENVWDRCYSEARGWYDPNTHQWRTDRDWDRNYDWDRDDRDHDQDRDNH